MKNKKFIIWFIIFVLFFLAVGIVIKYRGEAILFALTNNNQVLQTKKAFNELSGKRDQEFVKRLDGKVNLMDVINYNYQEQNK